jgi:LPS O-antigen subunit length determinant protein (WzzB/FepE family)
MTADTLLQLIQTLVSALAAVPNPVVAAVAIALGAAIMVYRKYRATQAVDPAEVADAAKKAQVALAAVEAALPKKAPVAPAAPAFDANVFGAMTDAEKAAAAKKS